MHGPRRVLGVAQLRLMGTAQARLLDQGHLNPTQHPARRMVLPGSVTALAGLWLLASGMSLGSALVPWLARWNETLCDRYW